MNRICYRKLKNYKYQILEKFSIQLDIKPDWDINYTFVSLSSGGVLAAKEYYAWDGPSGPTLDTKNFMRGSLAHDALYQLMRLSALDNKKYRKSADKILRDICREDGMCSFRAWYVYWGVRIFAQASAHPQAQPEFEKLYAS
jgi:hypothetical protein